MTPTNKVLTRLHGLLLAVALAIVLAAMPGCSIERRADQALEAYDDAERALAEGGSLRDKMEAERQRALESEMRAAAAEDNLARLIAQSSAELVSLQGEARAAMAASIAAYNQRLLALQDGRSAATAVVAEADSRIADIKLSLATQQARLDQSASMLDSLEQESRAALQRITEGVDRAAEVARSVPVAAPFVDTAREALLWGLSAFGIGGASLAEWKRRKAKKQADLRGQIIETTEAFGLIPAGDSVVKTLARANLSPEAKAELVKVTAPVAKGAAVPAPLRAAA